MSAELEHDPEPESLSDELVTVDAVPGCHRRLTWELRLRQAVQSWSDFRAALIAQGGLDQTRLASVWELELPPEGHRLIVVPATGRVQLRLHYLTLAEARSGTALAVASAIAAWVR